LKPVIDTMEEVRRRRYYDTHFRRDALKLLPGEYVVTDTDILLVTVLGSCVAACLRDRQSGIGGMNHFMLPGGEQGESAQLDRGARYGVHAMELLINDLLKQGARRENLEAKVFGGGNVLRSFAVTDVGHSNAVFVRKFLEREKIPLLAADLEDKFPRKVYFFPKSGRVMVKRLRDMHNYTIVSRESAYSKRIADVAPGGEVELFS